MLEEKDINDDIADIAEAIVKLADVGDALRTGPLRQKTLVLILQDITKVKKSDITYVLNALPKLREYVK